MLFDLQARGRRRVIKVIYLGLAVLMGGGLVFFGIGGNVSGGLFDAFNEGGSSAQEQLQETRDKASKRVKTNPRDPALWSRLATAEYQLAGQTDGFNPNAQSATEQFTGKSRKHVVAAQRAWQQHLKLAGDRPDTELAGTMRIALAALGDDEGAVRAQEIVIDGLDEPGFGDYTQLAQLAYQAGQTRKGDLAADKAVELAPKDQRKNLKAQLDALKTGGAAAGATTTPGS